MHASFSARSRRVYDESTCTLISQKGSDRKDGTVKLTSSARGQEDIKIVDGGFGR